MRMIFQFQSTPISQSNPAVRFILLLLSNKDIKARSWSPKQGVLILLSIGAAVTGATYYPDSINRMNTGGLGKITTSLSNSSIFSKPTLLFIHSNVCVNKPK